MVLKYKGHVFDSTGAACTCCVDDARVVKSDPTGTADQRRAFTAFFAQRWRVIRGLVKAMLVDQDLLQLKPGALGPVSSASLSMQAGSKTEAFQRWFDYVLNEHMLGRDGSQLRPHVIDAYVAGSSYAQNTLGRIIFTAAANERANLLLRLTIVELQGVMEAVSQQAVRAVANGLLRGHKPAKIMRAVFDRIERIGMTRCVSIVEYMVVRTFNEAVLDTYAAAGVKMVGLVPERVRKRPIGDAEPIDDARKRRKKRRYKKRAETVNPGSRVSRTQTPSRRTIERIRKTEEKIEKLGLVNVRTAGDDDVCIVCEEIAENGPYDINTARSLIPAHPHCRCTFVPANDRRFARD